MTCRWRKGTILLPILLAFLVVGFESINYLFSRGSRTFKMCCQYWLHVRFFITLKLSCTFFLCYKESCCSLHRLVSYQSYYCAWFGGALVKVCSWSCSFAGPTHSLTSRNGAAFGESEHDHEFSPHVFATIFFAGA